MHSCSMSVESMSATSSRLRRNSAGTTLTSIGWRSSALRTLAKTSGSRPSNGISQASPGDSQSGEPALACVPSRARRASSTSAAASGAFASAAMSDRTWLMKLSPQAAGDARAVLIAGPTAGGKSAAALNLAAAAERSGRSAWIVNADSMQVYDALRILTARPGPAEERLAPHRLYGHVPAATRYSVGAWLADATAVFAEAEAAGALPIVVGGTGLYFKALSEGLAAVPAIPAEVRARWSERLKVGGPA